LTAVYLQTKKSHVTPLPSGSDPTAVGEDGLLLDIDITEIAVSETLDTTAKLKKFFHPATPMVGKAGTTKLHRKCKICPYIIQFICVSDANVHLKKCLYCGRSIDGASTPGQYTCGLFIHLAGHAHFIDLYLAGVPPMVCKNRVCISPCSRCQEMEAS
jgi:hypothetical protein